MKTLGFLAATCFVISMSGTANAELFTKAADPSGAPMCFDASGAKAPLAACQPQQVVRFFSQVDPTGVKMCFAEDGHKAPLTNCEPRAAMRSQVSTKAGHFMAMLSFFR